MHVPLNRDAVRHAMPAFFDLLREEPHPAVRVELGHFIFVHIHPYMDRNGRVGRFLMITMMASGGYPWTIIPVTDCNAYVNALEKASGTTTFSCTNLQVLRCHPCACKFFRISFPLNS